MCGILGQVGPFGASVPITDAQAERWLETLDHRGPDGSASWRAENVWLGHTRLAIRDPRSPLASQPMVTPCGKFGLTYNGEIYNDAELRRGLEDEVRVRSGGRGFRTRCDAETLLWTLALRGPDGLRHVRGMYAFGFVDLERHTLLLGRDPLGIKPLVWSNAGGGVVFASEPAALTSHPAVPREVDPTMLAAYLVTSRRTVADRTMLQGVKSLAAGNVIAVDLARPEAPPRRVLDLSTESEAVSLDQTPEAAARTCAKVIEIATRVHLVSDVPVCSLLSGGLDSAIIARIAAGEVGELSTWCASGVDGNRELGPDPAFARRVAARLRTRHTDVSLTRDRFQREWQAHVQHLMAPLSTPNEVPIARIAQAIRADGGSVALSGEGADELFGGYDQVLGAFVAHGQLEAPPIDAARFHLEATAWNSPAALPGIVRDGANEACDFVIDTYDAAFRSATEQAGANGGPLDAHLRMQRMLNLTTLLERFDGAMMRHGVEGRTPFADVQVMRFAELLPIAIKYDPTIEVGGSKRVLRDAFRDRVHTEVIERPKASFPMPFEQWTQAVAESLVGCPYLGDYIHGDVLRSVAVAPRDHWQLSWLLSNVSLWLAAVHGEVHRTVATETRMAG